MEGLISSDRFHSNGVITYDMAEMLLEMPKLRVIQFHEVRPDSTSLKALNDVVFKRRKDITLRVYGNSEIWGDISFLNLLPDLERFDWDVFAFGPTEPLYKLNKLTHLGLGLIQPRPKISLKFTEDFKETLTSLKVTGDYRDFIDTIPNLRRLSTIWLTSTKLDNFDFLMELPIETIGNYGGRVKNFDCLRNLQTLKKVWIKTNFKLENIDFIENPPNLEDIEMQYVAKVTRFPKCDHLKNLKRIFLFECNGLEDIEEVKKMASCEIYVGGKKVPGKYYKKGNPFS